MRPVQGNARVLAHWRFKGAQLGPHVGTSAFCRWLAEALHLHIWDVPADESGWHAVMSANASEFGCCAIDESKCK